MVSKSARASAASPQQLSGAAVEDSLVGLRLDAATIAAAGDAAQAAVRPIDDLRADAEYRSEQVATMVRRALHALAAGVQADAFPTSPPFLGGPAVVSPTAVRDVVDGDAITATVNGSSATAPAGASETMLDWLREGVGLTGTKEGCAEGECGACTVCPTARRCSAVWVPAHRADGWVTKSLRLKVWASPP
ncbi:MAG: 2Fe-2S iron-sulfur cluster-binding protein [Acidimicrobiales bacterium]